MKYPVQTNILKTHRRQKTQRRLNNRISLLFATALLLITTVTLAQNPLADKQQIGLFKNSKTCVVLEDGTISYNIFIKDAVEKHWNTTDYEFIDKKEFEKRRFSSKYSFLLLLKGEDDKDPRGVSYDYLSLVLGSGTPEISDMPEFVSIPLAYSDDKNAEYGYAIPAIVKFIQRQVRVLDNKRFFISLFDLKYHNFSKNFRDKALLLSEEHMAEEVGTIYKIKAVYPNYVELLTIQTLEEKLAQNPENTLFLHHVGPGGLTAAGKCFEMIFDVEGTLYYYNHRQITNASEDGFNEKDLKRIR
ncbi:MAG: hypothetical protein WD577_05410 [Bacteroidales bacterium]